MSTGAQDGGVRDVALLDSERRISLADFCRNCGISVEVVVAMVHFGVLEPAGTRRDEWRFSGLHVAHARRALRLRRDLNLNWPGVALSLALLDELHDLRQRHRALRRRLDV